MANGHGGYRRPASPAPVSGPGSLSRRTDGGPADRQPLSRLSDAGYGEQKQYQDIQRGAPIAKVEPAATPAPSGAQTPSGAMPPPLDAPSANPDQPVTAGADAGAGPGSDVLGLFDPANAQVEDLAYLTKYLPSLQHMADTNPNVSKAFIAMVRYLRSQV